MGKHKREAYKGWCRCCLERGTFDKEDNLLDSVGVDTNNTSYLEMFLSCFSLNINFSFSHAGMDEKAASRQYEDSLICDLCIVRLKEAFAFRAQVELAQSDWESRLAGVRYEEPVAIEYDVANVKVEKPEMEDDPVEDSWNVEYLDEDRELVAPPKAPRGRPPTKRGARRGAAKANGAIPKYSFSTNWSIIKEEYGSKYVPELKWKRILYSKLNLPKRECLICKGIFNNTFMLIRHLTDHYPVYKCDFCGKAFCTRKSAILHGLTHEMEENKCELCGKVFYNKYQYRHHLERHSSFLAHRCNVCSERFKNAHQKRIHMVSAHDAPPNPYKCKQCSLAFLAIGKLNAHVRRIHLKERNQICSRCGLGFFSKFELNKHMFHCHGEEPTHKCDVCGKGFTWPKALEAHLKTHAEI